MVLIEGMLGKGCLGGVGELLYENLLAQFARLIIRILFDQIK